MSISPIPPAPMLELQMKGRITQLELTNDGCLLVVSQSLAGVRRGDDPQGVVCVYRVSDGALVAEYAGRYAKGAVFAEGGEVLYFEADMDTGDGRALYRARPGQAPELVTRHTTKMGQGLARDRSGQKLAVLGESLEVWDLGRRQVEAFIRGYDGITSSHFQAEFARDGATIYLYGLREGAVVQYDLQSRSVLRSWDALNTTGWQVTASSSGRYVAVTSTRGALVYDNTLGTRIYTRFNGFKKGQLQFPRFARDESFIFSERLYAVTYPLPSTEGAPVRGKEQLKTMSNCSAKAWDAPVYALGDEDGAVRVYQLASGG